jgi:hypothetical protein
MNSGNARCSNYYSVQVVFNKRYSKGFHHSRFLHFFEGAGDRQRLDRRGQQRSAQPAELPV